MQQNAPKFNCPQEGMYAAGNLGKDLLNDHLATFTRYSPLYTPEFVTSLGEQILEAEALPGETNRAGRRRAMRVNVKKAKVAAMNEWQNLKSYVQKAWTDPAEQKAKLSEAGADIYRKAESKGSWAIVNKLMETGNLFITENKTALQLNNNMPDGFEGVYQRKMTVYAAQYSNYSNTGSINEIQSNAKRKANNDVYDKVIQLCKDGQRIFKGDGTMQKQFAFSQMLKKVGYGGTAGVHFTLTYGNEKLPVAFADAVSSNLKYTGVGTAKGILKINKMAEGEYTFSISALGFDDLTVTVTLKAGVKSRFDFTMVQEVEEVQMRDAKAA